MRLQLAGFAQLALCCAKFGRLLTSAVELEVITTFVFGLYKIVQEFEEANRQCAMVQPNGKGGTASYRILIVHNHKNSRHSGVIVQPVRESIWEVLCEVGCAAFDVQFCVAQVVQNYRFTVRPLIDPGNVSKKLFPSASINFLMRLVITGSQCT